MLFCYIISQREQTLKSTFFLVLCVIYFFSFFFVFRLKSFFTVHLQDAEEAAAAMEIVISRPEQVFWDEKCVHLIQFLFLWI